MHYTVIIPKNNIVPFIKDLVRNTHDMNQLSSHLWFLGVFWTQYSQSFTVYSLLRVVKVTKQVSESSKYKTNNRKVYKLHMKNEQCKWIWFNKEIYSQSKKGHRVRNRQTLVVR